jgi:ABC-type nickel/cobalt efflux system permease component RcnA
MTSTGLIMMVVSNVIIVLLTLYCFWRVMTSTNVEETEHAPLEIDTRDDDTPKD